MRTVPDGLKAHLAGQATTLSHCWRLTRKDGVVLGFTDHDETVRFDGTVFEAASGLSGSEAEAEVGLAAGTQEVDGALSSLSLDETDIAAGRYDGAKVETFVVNWASPEQRMLLDVAELGEVTRRGEAFTAELRGIAAQLDRRRGRFYRRRCDAVLGDARCRVDLEQPRFRAEVTVKAVDASGIVSFAGAEGIERSLFEQGRVEWTGGAARGLVSDLASLAVNGGVRASFLGGAPEGIVVGDGATLKAGCDKSFATCRAVFANGLNFRGFPHLPGGDAAFAFAKKDGRHDGSPVVP
ncbi:DUF2163 domain-containing protein [Aureimonas leprariae]|uniref:DUF2163 domain-containing protein n=1 Tax=Plantimonas leprariae TaxID=2615207 RepID=A0A7V7PPL0_9HYPH|nr:DUF2163 domain-containing protein [Aureimonas leprariae]KAB0679942.1 DUF2163 domain-containing protein [Aureimonas leprariae]